MLRKECCVHLRRRGAQEDVELNLRAAPRRSGQLPSGTGQARRGAFLRLDGLRRSVTPYGGGVVTQ
jgi:hypothetical protein